MTADLTTLSESIRCATADSRYKREIDEKSGEIAKQLEENGVYENPESGLRITVSGR